MLRGIAALFVVLVVGCGSNEPAESPIPQSAEIASVKSAEQSVSTLKVTPTSTPRYEPTAVPTQTPLPTAVVSRDCREILAAKKIVDKTTLLFRETYTAISKRTQLSLITNSQELDRSAVSVQTEVDTAMEILSNYDDAYATRFAQLYSRSGDVGAFMRLAPGSNAAILSGDDRYLTLQELLPRAHTMMDIADYAEEISKENDC